MQDMPLSKTCPVKNVIYRLLIQATFTFVKEDYDKVSTYLRSNKKYGGCLLEYFYFNCKWWRKRVRMPIPSGNVYSNNILLVHSFIQNEPSLNNYYTDELRDYLSSFEQKCRDGLFEELSDVCLYKHIGIDSNGLDLWIRLRGSNRAENVHQKMKSLIRA